MHQLDQFTYLTQFFWLLIFYISFYVLLCYNGLPKISRILKLRKQLLSKAVLEGGPTTDKNLQDDIVMKESLSTSVSYLSSSTGNASEWCQKVLKKFNEKELLFMNKSFVSSVASMSVSHVLQGFFFERSAPSIILSANTGAMFVQKALPLRSLWLKVQRKVVAVTVKKRRKLT
uniref:H(+)-transporting two-sector ATPase n=1 Tax=Coleochaete scutata TaxID=3125 RepID=A0A5P9NWN3_COLSC|nr:ATP synthase F0 subunit 8 [Coleochaete scutata]QFU80133.1 ATP synthase F0 subunit 8 [Coleochaete scutata]QIQ23016.1 ATP synthase F0 subunit 8 [Coleochaete scutata]